MRDKQPDGSPTASPVPTDDRLSAPANAGPPTDPNPVTSSPPSSAGLRSVFAQWVVSSRRQQSGAHALKVPRPTPSVPAPVTGNAAAPAAGVAAPPIAVAAPALVEAAAPALVAAPESPVVDATEIPIDEAPVASSDGDRTQLYQRVPEHLLRKARPRRQEQAEVPVASPLDTFQAEQVPEEDRTAVFAPPSELLQLARRRAAAMVPAAGRPPVSPSSVDTLLDEIARAGEASRVSDEASPEEADDSASDRDSLTDEEVEMSDRIASLSGARAPIEDVTRVASFRKLMGAPSTVPPMPEPVPEPAGTPWYRTVGWVLAGLALMGALAALYLRQR